MDGPMKLGTDSHWLCKCNANFSQISRKLAKENPNLHFHPLPHEYQEFGDLDKHLILLILQSGAFKPLQKKEAQWDDVIQSKNMEVCHLCLFHVLI